jgi:NMD protein affecting ribosome stability and mRNA decay
MDLNTKICPVCGRSSKDTEFIGFFCTDDYMAQQKLKLPQEVQIKVCKRCDKVSLNEKDWKDSINSLKSGIATGLKGRGIEKVEIIDIGPREVEANFYFGRSSIIRKIPIFEKRTLCDMHTKMARGYYEATIQLRGDTGRIERMVQRILPVLNEITFVTGFNEYKYGADILVGSNEAVRRMLSNLKIKAKVTRKVWGAKRGETIYRITYLIQLPVLS